MLEGPESASRRFGSKPFREQLELGTAQMMSAGGLSCGRGLEAGIAFFEEMKKALRDSGKGGSKPKKLDQLFLAYVDIVWILHFNALNRFGSIYILSGEVILI